MIRWTIRAICRLIGLLFTVTLSVYILPFTNGLVEGVFLADMFSHWTRDTVRLVEHDLVTARTMDTTSVPGAPRIHDTSLPPYHIVQLRDPTNWWKKLRLKRFDLGCDRSSPQASGGERIHDAVTRLDTLYRRRSVFENRAPPWHNWIYVSAQPARTEGRFTDAWDEAFDELLRYNYAHATPYDLKFHYISCPGRSFCTAWLIKGPALLHLTTERSEEEESYLPKRISKHVYDPVTVRFIQLPINDRRKLPLLPGVFPSPFNQLRSVTADEKAWQMFDPYSRKTQDFDWFFALWRVKRDTHAQTYGRLLRLEEYLFYKVGIYGNAFWHKKPRLVGSRVAMWAKSNAIDPLWSMAKGSAKRILNIRPKEEAETATWEKSVQAMLLSTVPNHLAKMVRRQVDAMPEDARAKLMSSSADDEPARAMLDMYQEAIARATTGGDGAHNT